MPEESVTERKTPPDIVLASLLGDGAEHAELGLFIYDDDGKYVARNVPTGKAIKVTIEVEPINALAEGVRDQLRRSEERAGLLKLAKAEPAVIAQKIGVDADTLMSVNRIPAGMRLKGSPSPMPEWAI